MIGKNNFIEKLKEKNADALDYVVDNYGNLVFKIAYMNLNSRELSEEVVNEVLLKVWNSIGNYSYPKGKFKNWIAAIAKNTAVDLIRKEERFKAIEYNDEINKADKSIEDNYIKDEEIKIIKKYINDFDDIDRDIFIDRFFLGKPVNLIAEEKNMTANAISLRIFKGREKIKKIIEKEEI
ncbi:MAG: sigma-70 family RNA polymerase sigma factor [Sarcina sp.]